MIESAILLDTHAFLWWAVADRNLSKKVRRLMEDEATAVVVSAATAWEVSTKVRLGKLEWSAPASVQRSIEAYCAAQRFQMLPISFAHAERAGSWPQEHGDPFDRMLAAQGAIEGLVIASNDAKLASFGVATVW